MLHEGKVLLFYFTPLPDECDLCERRGRAAQVRSGCVRTVAGHSTATDIVTFHQWANTALGATRRAPRTPIVQENTNAH